MPECAACGLLKTQDAKIMQKNYHLHTIAQLYRTLSSQLDVLDVLALTILCLYGTAQPL